MSENQQGTGTSACVATGRGTLESKPLGVNCPGAWQEESRQPRDSPAAVRECLHTGPRGSPAAGSDTSWRDAREPPSNLGGRVFLLLGVSPNDCPADTLEGVAFFRPQHELQRMTRMKRRAVLHTARGCRPLTFPHTNVSAQIVLEPKWQRTPIWHYMCTRNKWQR